MKTIPLILAAAACQSAGVPAEPTAACSITVRFGSYAMGIDAPTAAAVDTLLGESPEVTKVSRSSAGREGEYVLCVSARDTAAAGRLFERLAALMPARPRGPITIEGVNKRVEAPRR
jgi:hypothetical protein